MEIIIQLVLCPKIIALKEGLGSSSPPHITLSVGKSEIPDLKYPTEYTVLGVGTWYDIKGDKILYLEVGPANNAIKQIWHKPDYPNSMNLHITIAKNPTTIPEELYHMVGTTVKVTHPQLYKKSS